MLFRHLAKARAGEAGEAELEANAGRLKTREWPYAVIELCLGKRSPTATLDAAVTPGDRCEAQFYIGQWHVLKASKARPRPRSRSLSRPARRIRSSTPRPSQELRRLRP